MSNDIRTTTDDTFEKDVLQSTKPVLVDFWAQWCGPCRMLMPIVDEISREYADRITVVKVNVDDNPNTPLKYAVRGIPSLLLFKDGNLMATKVGALSKSQLAAFLEENI